MCCKIRFGKIVETSQAATNQQEVSTKDDRGDAECRMDPRPVQSSKDMCLVLSIDNL